MGRLEDRVEAKMALTAGLESQVGRWGFVPNNVNMGSTHVPKLVPS
jgi:hypothetical protein